MSFPLLLLVDNEECCLFPEQMILQRYINSDWLHHSFHSWAQRCQNAQSAESIEMLKEVCNVLCLYDHVIQS